CMEIAATCDVVEERAEERAAELEAIQGRRPTVYTDLKRLLDKEGEVEAASICALHSEHHGLAVSALEAGRHVIIEKPLGITVRAARRILDAATRAQKVLAVAENYRRSPQERATNWAIRAGRIGKPRTFFWQAANEGLGKWGWRNYRHLAGGGWVLDGGVHFADLFRYHLGTQAREVYAVTRQYEPYRYDKPETRQGAWKVDVEDASFATIHFDDDVVVQWTWVGSAPGQGFSKRVIYGSEGCIDWDTGLWARGGANTGKEALIQEYRASLNEADRARLFPGGTENTFAIEIADFCQAVRGGTTPETDGLAGLRAQAICMAIFESGWFGQPVSVAAIERCEVEGYQAEVNELLGID
ncbi:MAG: Gfo/Idh/MocA family oxidoreductase, partial [Gemmatimonadota bacterium]